MEHSLPEQLELMASLVLSLQIQPPVSSQTGQVDGHFQNKSLQILGSRDKQHHYEASTLVVHQPWRSTLYQLLYILSSLWQITYCIHHPFVHNKTMYWFCFQSKHDKSSKICTKHLPFLIVAVVQLRCKLWFRLTPSVILQQEFPQLLAQMWFCVGTWTHMCWEIHCITAKSGAILPRGLCSSTNWQIYVWRATPTSATIIGKTL